MNLINILAIDDEAPIRQWLKYCITKFDGYYCETASNAKEGIEKFEILHPDIILTDIEMPGENGLEMLTKIKQLNSNVCCIVLTSHEDFSYAREALLLGTSQYMLKTEMTEESLRKVLDNAKMLIETNKEKSNVNLVNQEHFLQRIALHKNDDPVRVKTLAKQGIILEEAPTIVIDYWNGNNFNFNISKIKKISMLKNVYTFTLGTDHVLILANTSMLKDSALRSVHQAFEEMMEEQTNCCCGISDIVDSPMMFRFAIDQARGRCNMYFYEPDKRIFSTDAVFHKGVPGEEKFRMEFMSLLLNQEFTAAYKKYKEFAKKIQTTCPFDVIAVRKIFISVISSFFHFAANSQEDADEKTEELKKGIQESKTFPDMVQIVDKACFSFIQLNEMEGEMTSPIRQAISYLENHCADKISLTDVADQVSFSPEHFSRLFLKETGINFVTYLNNLRMKKAVSLLESTNMKVYEIAEMVGFSSLSYFSTAFKKKFGLNPYEYQVNYQRGKSKLSL